VVDPRLHAEELLRFEANVVRGPGSDDCAIWASAVGADGSGLSGREPAWPLGWLTRTLNRESVGSKLEPRPSHFTSGIIVGTAVGLILDGLPAESLSRGARSWVWRLQDCVVDKK
jgi:hypothetical protein